MSQYIDIGKNIRESLVVNKQPLSSEVKLENLLLEAGVDRKVIKNFSTKMESYRVAPKGTDLLYNSFEINGACAKFDFDILANISVEGNVCLYGESKITLIINGDRQTLRANIGKDGIKFKGEILEQKGEVNFSLKGNCLVVIVTGVVNLGFFETELTLYDGKLFCL